jgi:hypothetical protein
MLRLRGDEDRANSLRNLHERAGQVRLNLWLVETSADGQDWHMVDRREDDEEASARESSWLNGPPYAASSGQ